MNIKPTRGRVVVKATEVENKSAGGIVLPTDSKEPPTTGIVVACGRDEWDETFEVGDQVLFGKFAGTSVLIQNEKFIIMKMNEVMAVIEK